MFYRLVKNFSSRPAARIYKKIGDLCAFKCTNRCSDAPR